MEFPSFIHSPTHSLIHYFISSFTQISQILICSFTHFTQSSHIHLIHLIPSTHSVSDAFKRLSCRPLSHAIASTLSETSTPARRTVPVGISHGCSTWVWECWGQPQLVSVVRCPFFHKDDTHKSRSVSMESLEGQHGPCSRMTCTKPLCLLSFLAQENLAAVRWRLTWFRRL